MNSHVHRLKSKTGLTCFLAVGAFVFSTIVPSVGATQQLPVLQPNLSAGVSNGNAPTTSSWVDPSLVNGVGTNNDVEYYYSENAGSGPPPIANQPNGADEELTIYQPYPVPYGDASISLAAQQPPVQQQVMVQQPQVQYRYVQQPQVQYVQQPQIQYEYVQQPKVQYVPEYVPAPLPPKRQAYIPKPMPVAKPAPRVIERIREVSAPAPAPAPQVIVVGNDRCCQNPAPAREPEPQRKSSHGVEGNGNIINNNYNTIDIQVPQQQAAARTYAMPAPMSRATQISQPSSGCGILTASAKLNLRTGPGLRYNRVCTVPAGYRMQCGGCKGSWCKVGYKGRYFWASNKFLR